MQEAAFALRAGQTKGKIWLKLRPLRVGLLYHVSEASDKAGSVSAGKTAKQVQQIQGNKVTLPNDNCHWRKIADAHEDKQQVSSSSSFSFVVTCSDHSCQRLTGIKLSKQKVVLIVHVFGMSNVSVWIWSGKQIHYATKKRNSGLHECGRI